MLPLLATVVVALAPARVHVAPRVDGILDDAVWQSIAGSDHFTQSFPHDGAPASDPTRVRVAYDDDTLYVAIDCVQTVRPVVRLTRRDRDIDGDRVAIDLDTSHDRRSAFHFQVSAAGVLVDGLRYGDTELTTDWDDVWQAEVARTENGWSAEFAIPLRILRLHGSAMWGFQVRRFIGATGEEDRWAYAPRDAGGEVSRYGDLGPFDGLSPRGSLAVVPFALARFVHTDAEVPSPYGNGVSAAGGLDLTWRPTPRVTLQGAVLPDFAQVEADQLVINLTTTEIEYPEKRPFFLQGMDLFRTPLELLYTRRIGRKPDEPVLPAGAVERGVVGPAPVLAAAKLIATAGPLEIGALSVATGEVDAALEGGGSVVAAPSASDHALRVRASGNGFSLGALGTAQIQSGASRDALAGGIDGAWRSSDGVWAAAGQVGGSRISGGPPQLRLDGTQLRSGDTGLGGYAYAGKEGGTLRASIFYDGYSRRFDIDDLGYLSRANVHHISATAGAFSVKPFGPFIEERMQGEVFYRQNLDGRPLLHGYQWNAGGTTRGLWQVWTELHWRPAYYDDRELGDGRALQRSGLLGWELEVSSDPRRAVVGSWSSQLRSTHAGWELYVDSDLKVRPRDNLELDVQPSLVFSRGEPRFVDGGDASGPRFARLYASSVGVTARVTWTLQRDLTVQAYVQALLASLRHRDAFFADPSLRVIDIDDLRPASFDPAIYDDREGALDATIVARWEYRPGSTAFLVYSHAQTPASGAGFHPGALVHGPASDALLLKLSWAWFR